MKMNWQCRLCLRRYHRQYSRAHNYKGQHLRVARLNTPPEEKTRITEAAIAASFSDEHARAIHRIAFMPELIGEEDLQMWAEVVAGMVLQSQ